MAPESSYNEAWGSPTLVYLDIAEANITGEQNAESVPTQTFPGPTRAVLGDYSLAGPLNTVADTDLLGHLLKAAFGQCSTEQEVGWTAYQHIFHTMTPRGGVSKLPSYKMALGEDLLDERRLTGLYVPSIDFNFNMGEALQIAVNTIAAQETKATFSAPAVADHPADSEYLFHMNRLRGYVGDSTQIELGASGEGNALESLSISLNTNPTDDWRKSNSRFLHDFFMQEQEITGSYTLSFENMTELYRYFEGGENPSAVTPASRISTFPLIFSCDLGILVDDDPGGSELNYRLLFYMPKAFYTSYGKPQTRRDRSTIDIGFKALIPMTAPDLDATLFNSSAEKVAYVADTEFTDATEANRENSALYAVLHNAIASYA
jgi:hypothetical protein